MKWLFSFLLIPFLSVNECCNHQSKQGSGSDTQQQQSKDSLPACVRKLIDDAGKQSPGNLPVQIDEYVYNGKKVYFFTAQCCDQFNMLYDNNCKEICAASGGFTGRGDGKCKDFDSTAKYVRLIWKNPAK